MANRDALALAQAARTDTILNRWRRDSVTNEVHTMRGWLEAGRYVYRTRHVQQGKRDTYGLILDTDMPQGDVEYMTPVIPTSKLAFDYAAHLPVIEFNEDTATITREVTDAEWAHLTGS